jgi:UDP-galactopyranose mutase
LKYDYLIVGAGFAGCVLAERLASQRGKRILLIDKRSHIAGNAYDSVNEHGIRVHHYGPHLFHTNSDAVFRYLSQFTEWITYEHRVLASVSGKLVPMPVNRTTINTLFGLDLKTDQEVESFLVKERADIKEIRNSEDFVLSKVGSRLYEALYKGYTTKHWGTEPSSLSPSVCGRLPVRTNTDDRYFNDTFQYMPKEGYTKMFERMVNNPLIDVELNTEHTEISAGSFNEMIFTGPIDQYFNYLHGHLPYRSLRFEFETHRMEYYQPVTQVNYPNEQKFTRITEFKLISKLQSPFTTISKEYSETIGDPYYPIPNETNQKMYKLYQAESSKLKNVHFAGRLATYQYYNMDQVTAQALALFEALCQK